MNAPLDGLRVIDLSSDAPGVQAAQVLADLGADVIWVEPPGGSALRRRASYPFLARGRQSVIADLASPEGLTNVRRLAGAADVLIEGFRPGVADRLGVGYESLGEANPGLVYTSITGFGRLGPWAHLKGYEGVVASLLGVFTSFQSMSPGGAVPFISVPWCSFAASHAALHGVLAALLEREGSGRGQRVEVNMAQAVTVHEGASSSWYSYLVAQRWPDAFFQTPAVARTGIPMSPFVFRLLAGQTKDGRWLQFAQNRPRLFEAFLRALGLDWMLTDPKWEGIPMIEDDDQRLELWERMLASVRERTLGEWEAVFAADHDVFAEPYRAGPEALDHGQLQAGGLVIEVEDPERGLVRQPGPMFRFSETPTRPVRPAPLVGSGGADGWRGPPAWARRQSTPGEPDASAVRAARTGGGLPLAGMTVLELALQYAAPMGVTLLSDLGARIVKVEPLDGEAIRRQVPQFPEAGGGKVMQGKESIALDLKSPGATEIVHRLAARVDAVVEGFRDGAAARIGIDEASLRGINPNLVYVSAKGYGVGGPYADRPAFAPTIGAAAGIVAAHLGEIGPEDPTIGLDQVSDRSVILRSASAGRYASADGIAALGVATAVLTGLLARQRGAGGQHIESSMLLSAAHAMAEFVVDYPGRPNGVGPGHKGRGPCALYRLYQASDGWVFLAAPQHKEWVALAAALAPYGELATDRRFEDEMGRSEYDLELAAVLEGVFRTRPKADWQAELTAADVACVAVTEGAPEALLMSDEVGRAAGYITDIDHPVFDRHPRLAPIVSFSRSSTQARPGGLCGDSTDAILGELGYTPAAIAELREAKVVG